MISRAVRLKDRTLIRLLSSDVQRRWSFHAVVVVSRRLSSSSNDNNENTKKLSTKMPVPNTTARSKSVQSKTSQAIKAAVNSIIDTIVNPRETWKSIKEVIHHYWVGSKLLWSEIKVTRQILNRLFEGHGMTRRERQQLIRTATDIFRLIPFSIFIIVPFMEFLLPFALRLFPNMLPSTFQDTLKKEENMKQELQMRLAVAKFMQETLQEMAKRKKGGNNKDGQVAKELAEFIEKSRLGQPLSNDVVIRMAQLFQDELTLSNIPRPQLVSMCRYMQLQPYGADAFLRFQLRVKIRALKEDDRRILWEGIDSLDSIELRDACRERGMAAVGFSQFHNKEQLQRWLELSIQKNIPISLLIMSRAFSLAPPSVAEAASSTERQRPTTEEFLQNSMSSLDSDTINEIVVAVASGAEQDSIDIRKRKLESIQFQNELISEEREDSDGAKAASRKKAGDSKASAANEKNSAGAAALPAPDTVSESSSSSIVQVNDSASAAAITQPITPMEALQQEANDIETAKYLTRSTIQKMHEKDTNQPSIHQIQALSDLIRGSSVQRERLELAMLQATIDVDLAEEESTNTQKNAPEAVRKLTSDNEIDRLEAKKAVEQPPIFLKVREALSNITGKGEDSQNSQHSHTEVVGSDAEPTWTKTAAESKSEDAIVLADSKMKKDTSKPESPKSRDDRSIQRVQSVVNSMLEKLQTKIDNTEKALEEKFSVLDLDGDGELSTDELRQAIEKILKKSSSQQEADDMIEILDSDKDGKVTVAELLKYIRDRKEKLEIEALETRMKESAPAKDSPAAKPEKKAVGPETVGAASK